MEISRDQFDAILSQAEARLPLAQVIAEAKSNLRHYDDTPVIPDDDSADPAALAEIMAAGPAVDSLRELLARIERHELAAETTIIDQVAVVLDDRGSHAAAALVRDTDPDDDLWNNYVGPMIDEIERDYTICAAEIAAESEENSNG